VLNTSTMSPAARTAAGLLADDTTTASDHLPAVADFALGADPAPAGALVIAEFSFNDIGTDDRSFVELKNIGGRDLNLQAPVDYKLKLSNSGLPTSPPGTENEVASWDLQGVIPPGGLFVVYNSTNDSAAIKTTIESALPSPLQRQDFPGTSGGNFFLTNADNVALALVTVGHTDVSVTEDGLVEAYGYAINPAGSTRYFRTDSGNSFLITVGTAQQTTFGAGGSASDNSLARNAGNTALNTFTGWTIGATATPGTQNTSAVGDWALY
jgi:hypothetical protein